MTFSYAITKQTIKGDMRTVIGTWTNTGSTTGGDIVTGLSRVENCKLTVTSATTYTKPPVADETFPCGGTVTILCEAGQDGTFEIEGY